MPKLKQHRTFVVVAYRMRGLLINSTFVVSGVLVSKRQACRLAQVLYPRKRDLKVTDVCGFKL